MPTLPPRLSTVVPARACLVTVLAGPAWAQQPPIATVSAGYASIAEGDLNMPGFYVEGERRLTRIVSVVGQLHRATGSGEGYFSTIGWTDLFVGGGVRFSARPAPWLEPYAQGLAGRYEIRAVEVARPRSSGTSGSWTDVSAAFLVGGGVNLMPTPYFGFRVGADLQIFPDGLPNGRLTAGVVIPIGRR